MRRLYHDALETEILDVVKLREGAYSDQSHPECIEESKEARFGRKKGSLGEGNRVSRNDICLLNNY